jgi:hypothetical protein
MLGTAVMAEEKPEDIRTSFLADMGMVHFVAVRSKELRMIVK